MCLSLTSTPDVTNTPSTLSLVEKISTFQGFLPGFFRAFVTWLSKEMMTSFTELSILSMFSDAVKMHKDLFIAVRIDLVAGITMTRNNGRSHPNLINVPMFPGKDWTTRVSEANRSVFLVVVRQDIFVASFVKNVLYDLKSLISRVVTRIMNYKSNSIASLR